MSATAQTLSRADFRIAIICPLPLEAKVAIPLLDPVYDPIAHPELAQKADDPIAYTLGKIGPYYAVLAHMPTAGKAAASSVAANVRSSYPKIELAFLIGVCGGVPVIERSHVTTGRTDIYLGDVIVSTGVVQYDLGKRLPTGFVRKDTLEANLGRPNQQIRSFISKILAGDDRLRKRQGEYLTVVQGAVDAIRRGQDDILFCQDYNHKKRGCKCDGNSPLDQSVLDRQGNPNISPYIHLGRLASGDTVMMNAKARDAIAKKQQVIGFEMEGAGVWETIPCILVKGVSDYADSHKRKDWQLFAAASAAACMRALLDERPISISRPSTVLDQENSIPFRGNPRKRRAGPSDDTGKEREEAYLKLLTFPRADFRRSKILNAHEKTCIWVVERPEYQSWVTPDREAPQRKFFWIKGKPGAGKSTLMKYLLHSATSDKANDIVLSFFFYAQGVELERSTVGMYQSLLHQFLSSTTATPGSKQLFLDLVDGLQIEDGCVSWNKEDLEYLLLTTISSSKNCRIVILIDALDEGKETEIREMIEFFERQLIPSAIAGRVQLRVCLASRHYPSLVIDHAIQLVLEDQLEHESDIREYVQASFKGGKSKKAQGIQSEICERASGVFLWVYLVIRSLNEVFETGNLQAVRERLYEIPDDLDTLFTNILTRDKKSLQDMLFCLELVLFAPRPLSSEEAYFAIMLAKCGEVRRDPELHTDLVVANYIVHVSKGIVEARGKTNTVYFIHESVRDFLLRRDGFSRLRGGSGNKYAGEAHARIAQVCLNYICSVSGDKDFDAALATIPGLYRKDQREYIKDHVPFLGYARFNLLFHSNAAQEAGISQAYFLSRLLTRLSAFKIAYNAVECYQADRYADDVTLLYVLAHHSVPHLVSLEVTLSGYDWTKAGRHESPMGAAVFCGDLATVRALLGSSIDKDNLSNTNVISDGIIARMRDHLIASKKKRFGLGENWYSQSLVEIAIQRKRAATLELLFATGQFNASALLLKNIKANMYWPDKQKMLLDLWHSALSTIGTIYPRVFKQPSYNSSTQSVNLLPDYHCLDINHADLDLFDEKLLRWIVDRCNTVTLNLLISYGYDPSIRDEKGRDLLSHAAGQGKAEMVRTLTQVHCVDIDAKDPHGRTPLSYAASGESTAMALSVVSLLLCTRAVDVNAEDNRGRTPLFWAIVSSNPGVVEALLDIPGIKVDHKLATGHTLLFLAAVMGDERIVEMLLATGHIDINAQDLYGRTPLSWAIGPCFPYTASHWRLRSSRDRLACIRALLSSAELDPTIPDTFGYSPLRWARIYHCLWGTYYYGDGLKNKNDKLTREHEAIVEVLAQYGVVEDIPDASLDPRDYESCYSSDLREVFQLSWHWSYEVSLVQLLRSGELRLKSGNRGQDYPGEGPNGSR
ncbi:hypothetical protein BJX65DRAFT_71796 [Aspergillus insuetus]